MLEWSLGGVRCRVSLLYPALLAALLLWQPDGPAVSCVVASAVHEGGHLLAMLLLGYPPRACTLGAFGMRIRLGERLPAYRDNLLISAAGPAANLVSAGVLFVLNSPTAATAHLVLAVLNLLPASALDGGELLRCSLCLMGLEKNASFVLQLTSALILLPLAAVSGLLFLQGWGNGTLLIVSVYLVVLVFFSDKNEKNT